jgi:predicted GNAT family N-acyltransferase
VIEHLGAMPAERWAEILDGEPDPFAPGSDEFEWRPKTHHTLLLGPDGRAIASVGLVLADAGGFEVVGVGDVIVSPRHRGRGHLRPTLDAALERAATFGPAYAMLFCSPARAPIYARFGFREIDAPVSAAGRAMRRAVMWRPLRAGARWPDGPVSLPGLPF